MNERNTLLKMIETAIATQFDADARLAQLGLTSEMIRTAVEAGEFERINCSDLDPVSIPGIEMWRWIVVKLREQLIPRGWRPLNRRNLPLVVNPETRVAISVSGGDLGTGCQDHTPSTRHPKGPVLWNLVKENKQGHLFEDVSARTVLAAPKEDELLTYLLLTCPIADGTVRCELSLPWSIDTCGYIRSWKERIIIDEIALGPGLSDSAPAEIEIPVLRKK